jgi:transcriptional regulator with XRE-family HTH domain
MGVGPKIKEYRNKAGLTQKDLADKLHVTYQAVSRWENDDAEPSIDTLKEMCGIFNCSIEELFDMERKEEDKPIEEKITVVEKIVVQEPKPILGVCEQCNHPIYEASNLNRVNESFVVRTGRTSHTETRQRVLCNDCNEIRLLEEKRKAEQREREINATFKKRRIHSFIWPSLIALLFIAVGISSFVNGEVSTGFGYLGIGLFAYCFLGTMILNNTFITDMWLEIASWGFVKLPGIIFEFSFDGLVFLIAMKILFFLLGLALALLAAAFATALAMALSIFVYPFALIKNIKCEE